jgi:hypothetical protein
MSIHFPYMRESNKKYTAFALIIFSIGFASCKYANTNPKQLGISAQEQLKFQLARYLFKLPNRATEQTKFAKEFDHYYQAQASTAALTHYFRKGDTLYLQISKLAPSLTKKKTATALKVAFDAQHNLLYYEEVYRTWKLEEAELKPKSDLLFNEWIAGRDLSPYYTANSGNESYIEFPDANTYYNVLNREWETD